VRRAAGAPFHVAGRLELNRWRGRETVQLRVSDVAEADGG
jgi:single-stranded-DNA-specific exonuclease